MARRVISGVLEYRRLQDIYRRCPEHSGAMSQLPAILLNLVIDLARKETYLPLARHSLQGFFWLYEIPAREFVGNLTLYRPLQWLCGIFCLNSYYQKNGVPHH